MPVLNLNRNAVSAIRAVTQPTIFFDQTLKGFGLKVNPPSSRNASGARTWVIEYRPADGGRRAAKRRHSLGSAEVLKADEARKLARDLLARIRLGEDPAAERTAIRRAETVSELIALYMSEKIKPLRKASTARTCRGYVDLYLTPQLGSRKAASLTRGDIAKLHRAIGTAHKVTANRVVSFLSAAYSYGQKTGRISEQLQNPARGIERFREEGRERYLSADELARLGDTLRLAETTGLPWAPDPTKKVKHAPRPENRLVVIDPYSIAALRLLLFTGARLREILHLEWEHVDLQRGLLFLPDSKTGKKTVLLGAAAIDILENLERVGPYVIAGTPKLLDGKTVFNPRSDLNRPWARVTSHAGLSRVRLHDLRHSFASVGVSSGLGLEVIGGLLGHSSTSTTARYAHLGADPLRRASNAIEGHLAAALGGKAGADHANSGEKAA